jgi:hypothetical protein
MGGGVKRGIDEKLGLNSLVIESEQRFGLKLWNF